MLNKMIYHDVHYKSDNVSKIEAAKEIFDKYTKKLRVTTEQPTSTTGASSSSR